MHIFVIMSTCSELIYDSDAYTQAISIKYDACSTNLIANFIHKIVSKSLLTGFNVKPRAIFNIVINLHYVKPGSS